MIFPWITDTTVNCHSVEWVSYADTGNYKSWFNFVTPKISLVILLLTFCHVIIFLLVGRICCLINLYNTNPNWQFLCSYHLPAWYCIDIVRRNSVFIIHGNYSVLSSFSLVILSLTECAENNDPCKLMITINICLSLVEISWEVRWRRRRPWYHRWGVAAFD